MYLHRESASSGANNTMVAGPDARDDLLATLAAGRELGPEMDAALAQSYLNKHPRPADVAPPARHTSLSASTYSFWRGAGVLAACAIFAAALIASGGHAFWLFWLPFVFALWWWRWPGSRWRG